MKEGRLDSQDGRERNRETQNPRRDREQTELQGGASETDQVEHHEP